MNPIALEAMRRDPTLALGAVNNLNASLHGRSRLDQIFAQAQQQNEMANKRMTLDDFVQRAGVDNQGQMTLAKIAEMAGSAIALASRVPGVELRGTRAHRQDFG